MSFSDYLENQILNHVFGAQTFTPPSNLYIALSSTTPNDNGTNFTQPTTGGYARVAVANTAFNWPAATNGTKVNANPIQFPEATGSWGDALTHWGIYDASVGGNFLGSGALLSSQLVFIGDVYIFPAGSLVINLS